MIDTTLIYVRQIKIKVSLAEHNDCKKVETASLALLTANDISLPAPLRQAISSLFYPHGN